MTALASLSCGNAETALGWSLLHFLWQGAILAIILNLFLLRCESATRRYGAACLTLILMTLCPVFTFLWLLSPAPLDSAGRPMEQTVAQALPGCDPRYLVALWLAGVFIFSLRLLGGGLVLRQLVRRGTHTCEIEWQQRAAELARRFRIHRPVVLLHSAEIQVPTIIGCFRGVILLPVSTLSGLPMPQIEALLAHELAHIRRCDYLANLCQMVIESLFFYHPAVWWVSQQMRIEREVCCDDMVVSVLGDRLTYARALASLAELRSTHPLALASNGGNLMARIRHIVGLPRLTRSSRTLKAASVLSLVLISGAALLWQLHAAASPVAAKGHIVKPMTAASPAATKGKTVRPVTPAPHAIPAKSIRQVSSQAAGAQSAHVEDDQPGQPEDDRPGQPEDDKSKAGDDQPGHVEDDQPGQPEDDDK